MKRFSPLQILLLCLPFTLISLVVVIKVQGREKMRVYYSHPFMPRFELVRGEPTGVLPGIFKVQANCLSSGGRGRSHWLVRGQLLDISGTAPQEIWSSQKWTSMEVAQLLTVGTEGLDIAPADNDGTQPVEGRAYACQFQRHQPHKLKFIAEAIVWPAPDEIGIQTITIDEATPAQIAQAREQPGARYFRESLILDAKNNPKP